MIEIKRTGYTANPTGLRDSLKAENPEWAHSTGGDWSIAWLPDDATQLDQDTATEIQDAHNTLEVAATKTSILADNTDETVITCDDLGLSFDYRVWVNGIASIAGSIADGTMEYSTNQPGEHIIEIKHQLSYATGYVTIEVLEVV